MKSLKYILLGFVLAGQTACVSMQSLQTAEVLKPGQTEQTVGGGSYNGDALGGIIGASKVSGPVFIYTYRRGFMDDLDFGLQVTSGTYGGDVKYRLLDNGAFKMATALGLNYANVSIEVGGTKTSVTAYDLYVPLLMSYAFSKDFTGYISPRYGMRMLSGNSGSSSVGLAGANVGFKWGQTKGVYVEAGYQKQLTGEFSALQYNAAFFWTPK